MLNTVQDIIDHICRLPQEHLVLLGSINDESEEYENLRNLDARKLIAERVSELTGLPLLGFGGYRVVLDAGNFVLKIPFNEEGRRENLWEYKLLEDLHGTKLTKLFTKIYHHSDIFIVVEKVKPFLTEDSFDPYRSQVQSLLLELESHSIYLPDVAVYNYSQFGLRDQDVVVVLDFDNRRLNTTMEEADEGLRVLFESMGKSHYVGEIENIVSSIPPSIRHLYHPNKSIAAYEFSKAYYNKGDSADEQSF